VAEQQKAPEGANVGALLELVENLAQLLHCLAAPAVARAPLHQVEGEGQAQQEEAKDGDPDAQRQLPQRRDY